MRTLLCVLGIAVCVGLHQAWLACATRSALGEDARLAIEIRCAGRDGDAAAECRRLLGKLYLAGTLDPEKALREHCTPAKTVTWGVRPPSPPAVCVERYGGWRDG